MSNILPTLLLIFYPIKLFRTCLSKCRLDGIALNIFVEKFYGCYRDGLDSGRDMRGFAGLYFVVRPMIFIASMISSLLMISNNDPHFSRNIVFMVTALLIALCRPYKRTYMNVLDTFLLVHFGLLCHLMSAYDGFQVQANFALTFEAMFVLPLAGFMLFFVVRALWKVYKNSIFKILCQKCKHFCHNLTFQYSHIVHSTHKSSSIEQVLVKSTVTEISYGTIN